MIPFPAPLDVPRFRDFWQAKWLPYLNGKHGGRVTQQELELQLVALARDGPDKAIDWLSETMQRGWKGLYERKIDGKQQPSPSDHMAKIKSHTQRLRR